MALTRKERKKRNRLKWRARRKTSKRRSSTSRRARRPRRASRRSTRRSSKSSSRRKRRSARGFSSDYALGRAYGIRAPKGMRRKAARKYVGKAGLRRARRSAGRVVTLSEVMKRLRRTKMKAWICAGARRTGCGGGRKRYGGSRQIGVLRP